MEWDRDLANDPVSIGNPFAASASSNPDIVGIIWNAGPPWCRGKARIYIDVTFDGRDKLKSIDVHEEDTVEP